MSGLGTEVDTSLASTSIFELVLSLPQAAIATKTTPKKIVGRKRRIVTRVLSE